ncbi:MAG: acetate--CoA ligase family protein [Lautropia sp.]
MSEGVWAADRDEGAVRRPAGGATGEALARALLRPASVALVGISDDPAKTSGRPLRFMRAAGYAGTIYNVNPQRDSVQGEKAWPSLDALPERPCHVFVLTGAEQAIATLEQCAAIGVPIATVLAGGFAESGPDGAARERRLVEVARRGGVRLLGPSSIGVVNVRDHLLLTANAAFAEPGLPPGDVLFASQSGSLIGALTSRGRVRDIGFHSLVSVGGEADLSIGEICSATLDDPQIRGYALFLESMRHAHALRRFAEGAAARGKPVVAYKLGRSAVGAELAVSHTGSLAGDDALADAFMRHVGIVRVNTFEGLLEALPLVRHAGAAPRARAVGVVTTTGGGAAMVVDQLGVRGVDVVAPTPHTLARLAAAGVTAAPGRIVDLTLAGTRYETMKATLDVMLSAPEFGLVLVSIGSSARSQPQLAVRPVIDSAGSATPLAVFIVPEAPDALAALSAAKVANFRTPETCADAIAAVLSRATGAVSQAVPAAPPAAGRERLLDELEAYAQLARVGIAHAPAVAVAVADVLDAPSPMPALPVEQPAAVKLLDASVLHKSDLGGVALGVTDGEGLATAVRRMQAALQRSRPALRFERVLVQSMRKGLGEVLLGFRRDPEIGPVVVLAAGGLMTEIQRDSTLRLAPIVDAQAREMIDEVRALRVLRGYRGLPPGDVDALARALVAMSRLALLDDPWVVEAEVNPLMVMPAGQGVVAVDAVVKVVTDREDPSPPG